MLEGSTVGGWRGTFQVTLSLQNSNHNNEEDGEKGGVERSELRDLPDDREEHSQRLEVAPLPSHICTGATSV